VDHVGPVRELCYWSLGEAHLGANDVRLQLGDGQALVQVIVGPSPADAVFIHADHSALPLDNYEQHVDLSVYQISR
jgi:hypothetical protein